MELGNFFFWLVCFISLFLYLTILFNNFSVKDMVNILGLACNHDTRKNTLKKGLLPWAILQDQNLNGSGGCWPCCYGLVIVLFWFFLCESQKRENILWTSLCKIPKLPKAKTLHTHWSLKKKKKSPLSPLTSLDAILKEIALDQLAIENPAGMGQLVHTLPKRKQNCHIFCLRCGRKKSNQIAFYKCM